MLRITESVVEVGKVESFPSEVVQTGRNEKTEHEVDKETEMGVMSDLTARNY